MPRSDWKKNNVQRMFSEWDAWPWGLHSPSTVLDVGCGLSFKSQYIDADLRVGVDIYKPYLEAIPANMGRAVPFVAVCCNALAMDRLFLPGSFDLVLLLDIIEHLEKDDSIRLLKIAERIASTAVIIETPNGFHPQNIDILGFEGHHWQTHRCGWSTEELEDLGYRTFVRPYRLSSIKRYSELDVPLDVELIDAIKLVT
jgi:SAM-dependent methyltransferase